MSSISKPGLPLVPIQIGYFGSCPVCGTIFIVPSAIEERVFVSCSACDDAFLVDPTCVEYDWNEEEDE